MKSSQKNPVSNSPKKKRFLLAVPAELEEALGNAAYRNWRSRTAEINARLGSTFEKNHGVIVVPRRSRGE